MVRTAPGLLNTLGLSSGRSMDERVLRAYGLGTGIPYTGNLNALGKPVAKFKKNWFSPTLRIYDPKGNYGKEELQQIIDSYYGGKRGGRKSVSDDKLEFKKEKKEKTKKDKSGPSEVKFSGPAMKYRLNRGLDKAFGSTVDYYKNLGKKVFEEKAALFLDKNNPGLHNQAMMELGALVCTPKNPSCFNCPLSEACLAFTTNSQERYPVKEKKLVMKPKFFYYFNLNHKQNIALFKRPAGGIWQGLYDLPLLSSDVSLTPEGLQKEVKLQLGLNLKMKDLNECQWSTKHLLTHQRIQAYYFSLKIDPELLIFPQEILWVNKKDLTTYATSRLLEKYWEATQFN
jgi:hypothetical protein